MGTWHQMESGKGRASTLCALEIASGDRCASCLDLALSILPPARVGMPRSRRSPGWRPPCLHLVSDGCPSCNSTVLKPERRDSLYLHACVIVLELLWNYCNNSWKEDVRDPTPSSCMYGTAACGAWGGPARRMNEGPVMRRIKERWRRSLKFRRILDVSCETEHCLRDTTVPRF